MRKSAHSRTSADFACVQTETTDTAPMPADAPALASRPMRLVRHNPFGSSPATNPLMTADALTLVPVPDAITETHEPRKPRRSYLAPGGGGGGLDLSELLSGMRGKRPPAHEREAVDDDDDQPGHVPEVPTSSSMGHRRR